MDYETYIRQRDALRQELIDFLRAKGLSYGQAKLALKDAQRYIERAALKNLL